MALKTTTIYTQADLDNIDLAIATGAASVEFQGKKHIYRKMNDMIRARRWIYSCLCLVSGQRIRKTPMFRTVCSVEGPPCCEPKSCGCTSPCNC